MANDTFAALASGGLTASAAALFTGADAATGVKDLVVFNANTAARAITVHVVKAGKSYGDASDIVLANAVSCPQNGMFRLRDHTDPEIELGLGDAIYALQDAGTDCTYKLLGA